MKISFLKIVNDEKSFKFVENMGFEVRKINDVEKTDDIINELVENKYDTIVLSNEVAGFSEDIIKKYGNRRDLKIIITPSKK